MVVKTIQPATEPRNPQY